MTKSNYGSDLQVTVRPSKLKSDTSGTNDGYWASVKAENRKFDEWLELKKVNYCE